MAGKRRMTWAEARILARAGIPIRLESWTEENRGILWPVKTITSVDILTDLFTLSAHKFAENVPLLFSSTEVMPTAVVIPNDSTGTGQEISLLGYITVTRNVAPNTFGVRLAGLGSLNLDITNAGSGTLYAQRQSARLWLVWDRAWWRWNGVSWVMARAHDVMADEYASAMWTTMTEAEIATAAGDIFISPPGVIPGLSSSGTVTPPESGGSAEPDPSAANETTQPAVISTDPVLGGGSSSTAAASDGGGGSGGGGGGNVMGGGNSSGGGAGGGGPNIGNQGGGSGGGGGGGGGGDGGGGGGGGGVKRTFATPTISLTHTVNYQLLVEGSGGYRDPPGIHDARVSGTVSLGVFDETIHLGSPTDLFFVKLVGNGRVFWRKTMQWGATEGWSFLETALPGTRGITIVATVWGGDETHETKVIEPPSDPRSQPFET